MATDDGDPAAKRPPSPGTRKRSKWEISPESFQEALAETRAREAEEGLLFRGAQRPALDATETAPRPLRARSVNEEKLYIEIHPCPCGERKLESAYTLEMQGNEMFSVRRGTCPGCGRQRTFEFVVPEPTAGRDWVGFGGREPSVIIDPGQFLAASDRWAETVPAAREEIERLDAGARLYAHETMLRVVAAMEEVLKFIPPGAAEVPEAAFHSAEGTELRRIRPTHFRRAHLQALLDAYRHAAVKHEPPGGPVRLVISKFFGVIVSMNYREHCPPHFQASYSGAEVTVNLADGNVTGEMPKRALALVLEWWHLHRDELEENWQRAEQRVFLNQIDPLE